MAAPSVSVVLPVYNGRRYIAASIESILLQTFSDFELIVVDDGSTDGTHKVVQGYLSDPRVRLIRRPNTGVVGASNDGLAASSGALHGRMDTDDIALPQKLEKQVAYMRMHPECVACGTQVEAIDPYGCPLFLFPLKQTHEEIDAELMRGRGGAMVQPSVMMRRDAILRVGRYRPQYSVAEDLDLFLRLAEVGKLANLPDTLLQYRLHYESVNHRKHEMQREMGRGLMAEAYARRGVPLPPEPEKVFIREAPPPRYEQTSRWGWAALKKGNTYAARRHALDALRLRPLKPESWKLLLCAARGH